MKGNCSRLERWDGSKWDSISKKVSMSGPGLSRETVEEDLEIDCAATGGNSYKKKSPGTKEIGDISVEIKWNPVVPTGANQRIRATVVGTITAAGNASLTVTTAGMNGSPQVLAVPMTNGLAAAGIKLASRAGSHSDGHATTPL